MASFLTHSSVFIFYFLFPGKFDLVALLVGAQIIDLEYVFIFFHRLIKFKNLKSAFIYQTSICHTIPGSLLICLPLTVGMVYKLNSFLGIYFNIKVVVISSLIGFFSKII